MLDYPGGIQPVHVFVTLIASATVVVGFLWRMTKSLVHMEFKLDLLWKDYMRRFGKGEDGDR